MTKRLQNALAKLHRDTRGAMSVEKVLILALIALPIVLILLAFRKTAIEWFNDQKTQIQP